MVSSHVNVGRRNLAANTILLMRRVGMNAFQTVLLPQFSPQEIKRLNHLKPEEIEQNNLNIGLEIQRVIAVTESVTSTRNNNIHFASHISDVILNLHRWNKEIATSTGIQIWGKRTVTYFVFDPISKQFAPSKFCAYVPIEQLGSRSDTNPNQPIHPEMSIALYSTLDGADSRFDGRRARLHLTKGLAMAAVTRADKPLLGKLFDMWLNQNCNSITVHPSGPVFISPPDWY